MATISIRRDSTTISNRIVLLILGIFSVTSIIFAVSTTNKSFIDNSQQGTNQPVRIITEESATINAVKKVGPSVVTVIGKGSRENGTFKLGPFFFVPDENTVPSRQQSVGSGFIISEKGYLITNKHVVSNKSMQYIIITSDNKEYSVKSVYPDPNNDIAVLQIDPSQHKESNLVAATIGDSSNLQVGQFVVAIGTVLGEFRNTVTTGVISGLERGITAQNEFRGETENLKNLIQTSAAVNFGNSGGPLVNANEEVIGINTAIAANGQNIGFALPVSAAKKFINSLGIR